MAYLLQKGPQLFVQIRQFQSHAASSHLHAGPRVAFFFDSTEMQAIRAANFLTDNDAHGKHRILHNKAPSAEGEGGRRRSSGRRRRGRNF